MKLKEAVCKLNERGLVAKIFGKDDYILGGTGIQPNTGNIEVIETGFVILSKKRSYKIIVSQENNFDYEATFDDLAEAVEAVCEKVAVEFAV